MGSGGSDGGATNAEKCKQKTWELVKKYKTYINTMFKQHK